jgi:hypothetical protein
MQPPDYDDDAPPPRPYRDEPPRTGIPKVIGILNIIFGVLLMLCSVCTGLSLAMQSAMGPAFAAQQQELQKAVQVDRNKKLQELRDRAQAAKDEKEKADLQGQEKALQAQPLPKMPDMSKFIQESSLQVFTIADFISGLIFNILLLVSGFGLVRYKEWGRQLGLWVAALKIVRLIVLYGFLIVVVVPRVTQIFTSMVQEMAEQMPKAGPPGQRAPGAAELAQMSTMMQAMYTGLAVGMILLGSIYPIIVLILLSRPRVKAACASTGTALDDLPPE